AGGGVGARGTGRQREGRGEQGEQRAGLQQHGEPPAAVSVRAAGRQLSGWACPFLAQMWDFAIERSHPARPRQLMAKPMATSTVTAGSSFASTVGRYRWLICSLLFLATTINYIDRQVLALIKGTLDNELHWSNADYGAANSWFQLAYAGSLFLFGWFIDRFGV